MACLKTTISLLQELFTNFPELGVNDKDDHSRANKLVNLLTLFFSHPSVKGVLLWGFWDGQIWEKDAPLFNGPNLTVPDFSFFFKKYLYKQLSKISNTYMFFNEDYHEC